MTPRSPQSGIPPVLRKPPIAEELDKLRELPPRTTNREGWQSLKGCAAVSRPVESPNNGVCRSRPVQRLKGRIYAFHFSDGEDFSPTDSMQEARKLFDKGINMFGYGEIQHLPDFECPVGG